MSSIGSLEQYTCAICLDEVDGLSLNVACWEHVLCEACIERSFHLAMTDATVFPANCCGKNKPLSIAPFRHLFESSFVTLYTQKLLEHQVPVAERVYCANHHCSEFIHPSNFSQEDAYNLVAYCRGCGWSTCTKCKAPWEGYDHFCSTEDDAPHPEYSDDFRCKKCPRCRLHIQLTEACNHMTCASCQWEFCFVCLDKYSGAHDCPTYGDPEGGYDEEGFERWRGIHIHTALDREGYDRHGYNDRGEYRAPSFVARNPGNGVVADDVELQLAIAEGWEADLEGAFEAEEVVPADQAPQPAAEGEAAAERLDIPAPLVPAPPPAPYVPVDVRHPTFIQIDCSHNWQTVWTSCSCRVCWWYAPIFHKRCSECGVTSCRVCSMNWRQELERYCGDVLSMVAPLLWAEAGVVPFRVPWSPFDFEWEVFGTEEMFDDFERQFNELHPFLNTDFGLESLFGEAEEEWWRRNTYHVVEIEGFNMVFRWDSNSFWLLEPDCEA